MNRFLRRLMFGAAIALISALPGCAPPNMITESNVDNVLAQFRTGSIQLSESPGMLIVGVGDNLRYGNQFAALAAAQDWPGLSKLVIEVNEGNDLSWFYLGLSAAELGYPQAARVYLEQSMSTPFQNCAPGPGYDQQLCFGLQLPQETLKVLHILPPAS